MVYWKIVWKEKLFKNHFKAFNNRFFCKSSDFSSYDHKILQPETGLQPHIIEFSQDSSCPNQKLTILNPSGFDYLIFKKTQNHFYVWKWLNLEQIIHLQKHRSWLSIFLFSNFSFGIELPTSLPYSDNINCQLTTTSKR